MTILSSEMQGSLYAITSGLLYGLVGYFGITLMESHLSIANVQFWRFFISAIFISLILLPTIKTIQVSANELLKAFMIGFIFDSISAGMYFLASDYIGSGLSMVILYTFPAFVLLLNWLLYKTKVDKIYYLAIGLILIGMTQVVDFGQMKLDLIGMSLALLAGILYACYLVGSKSIQLPPLVSGIMVSFGSASALFVFCVFNHDFIIPQTSSQWLHILGFGIISTALPMLLLLQALKKTTSERVSILSILEPVFVVIFGFILLDEILSFPKIMGMTIILSGAILILFSHHLINHPVYRKVWGQA